MDKKKERKDMQEETLQEATPKYPSENMQEMARLKGFTSIEAMVEFFIDKQMGLYYSKKEEN